MRCLEVKNSSVFQHKDDDLAAAIFGHSDSDLSSDDDAGEFIPSLNIIRVPHSMFG